MTAVALEAHRTAAPPVPLVLVGHGSRDWRFAQTLDALADVVRRRQPDLDVRLGYLELTSPSLEEVLASGPAGSGGTAGTAGPGDGSSVVVVPLLLGAGFHAQVDLPRRAAAAAPGAAVTPVLGPDPRLEAVAAGRARELAADKGVDAFVLVATGSSDPEVNGAASRVASRLEAQLERRVGTAFATATSPTVASAVRSLRDEGHPAGRIGLLPWFLAPGLLLDRAVRQAAEVGVQAAAPPLGEHDLVASVILDRYASSVTAPPPS
ncbi:MAG: sirohydrochlorin chelatase [Lapillicoccus sp.]